MPKQGSCFYETRNTLAAKATCFTQTVECSTNSKSQVRAELLVTRGAHGGSTAAVVHTERTHEHLARILRADASLHDAVLLVALTTNRLGGPDVQTTPHASHHSIRARQGTAILSVADAIPLARQAIEAAQKAAEASSPTVRVSRKTTARNNCVLFLMF